MASPPRPATLPTPPTPEALAGAPGDLRRPELYINRELSLLEFNRRVLEQAKHPDTPLLERLRFLCITSTNMDEFFEIRVAGLQKRVELGSVQVGPDGLTPADTLKAIGQRAHHLVAEQYRVLNEVLFPALAEENIRFARRDEWTPAQDRWLRTYFEKELLPVLSPLGLDPAHPFPRILNKSLNFIVQLKGKDAFGRTGGFAVVQAPRALPRLIHLPPEASESGRHDFVFLSSVIHAYVQELFPGMKVEGSYQFRVTRDSDLLVDEEEVDDLLRAVEGELHGRRYGEAVRLEAADSCPEDVSDYLLEKVGLDPEDLFIVNGPVNLNRLAAVIDLVDRPDLKYKPFTPGVPTDLTYSKDLFEVIRKKDILLHHPYESFLPVIDFVRQAAADPQTLAIKVTLYRTGTESALVDALLAAAKAGKEVTVVIELRARFDEEANIRLATELQEAGAHVVYGVVGYKTHAKMLLVVRREGRRLRYYVHLGTGNYHSRTARLYTDYGLFTCDRAIGEDVHKVFLQLTSFGKAPKLEKLLQSPFTLRDALLAKIDREILHAKAGRPARIIMKVNALIEATMIEALYRASQAGVQVDLIVRGMCCLRPGIPGVSEHIRVRSIVGRFLEHPRVYSFYNDGESEMYCSSADLMERNLYRRVELAFPVEARKLRKRLLEDLEIYLGDNVKAWAMHADGTYTRFQPAPGEEARSAQLALLSTLAEAPSLTRTST